MTVSLTPRVLGPSATRFVLHADSGMELGYELACACVPPPPAPPQDVVCVPGEREACAVVVCNPFRQPASCRVSLEQPGDDFSLLLRRPEYAAAARPHVRIRLGAGGRGRVPVDFAPAVAHSASATIVVAFEQVAASTSYSLGSLSRLCFGSP